METDIVNASMEEASNTAGPIGELQEVDLAEKEHGDDEKGVSEEDIIGDDHSEMSASFCDDEASSVLDKAERDERQVRKSLFFAILSACGMMFCMSMIQKVIARFANTDDSAAVLDADDVVAAGREAAQATATTTANKAA